MKVELETLSQEEKQALANSLHAQEVFPTVLLGQGSPAHVQAVLANLNDVRQMLSVELNHTNRLFDMMRAPRYTEPPPPPKNDETDNGT